MTAGAPTKYNPKYNKQAYKLSLLGVTNDQLADILEIGTTTLKAWKNKYPEFKSAIKKGKDITDANVAVSLLKRATGYKYNEITYEPKQKVTYKDGKRDSLELDYDNLVVTKKVKKEMPPDTGAAFIWLKNRQPDKWRDRKDEEGKSSEYESIDFEYTEYKQN